MQIMLVFLLFLLCFFAACSPAPPPPQQALPEKQREPSPQLYQLVLRCPQSVGRAEPSFAAHILWRYKALDTLRSTGRFADTLFALDAPSGQREQSTWLECLLPDGRSIWLYSSCFELPNTLAHAFEQHKRKLHAHKYIGKDLAEELLAYAGQNKAIGSLGDFKRQYQLGTILRDTLQSLINRQRAKAQLKSEEVDELLALLPGFVLHNMQEEEHYYLWRDFRYWEQRALQSPETEDEEFLRLFFKIYSIDSIEYLHEDWQIDCGLAAPCSYLGRGILLDILADIQNFQERESAFFREESQDLRFRILKHLQTSTKFWLSREEASQELDSLIALGSRYWTASDLKILRQVAAELQANSSYRFNYWDGSPE